MNDEPQPGMSEEFKARMRQGLSSMAVRERVRERRRNRAIAGGAVATVTAVVLGVGVWQIAGAIDPRVDQAAVPTTSVEPSTTPTPAPTPTPTSAPTAPTETAEPEPTPPPGFEGIAAGTPFMHDFFDCADDCGDTGAGGSGPVVERTYDVYVVCEGAGTVSYGEAVWVDCGTLAPGSGFAELGVLDTIDDGDPQFTASSGFTGQLSVVERGAPSSGSVEGSTATVFVECSPFTDPVTVGGTRFACDPDLESQSLAAWGIPILPGEIAPRIEGVEHATIRFVVER